LTVCNSGTTESTGVILTLLTSLPVSSPRLCAGTGERKGKKIPTSGNLVSEGNRRAFACDLYAQGLLITCANLTEGSQT
jgi:hypothetical protein